LALTKVERRAFEREDRLVVTAVLEGAEVLRPAEVARELIQQPCEDVAAFDPPIAIGAAELVEIVDEELVLQQSEASPADQAAFDAALDQLEQSMADRLLVLRRAKTREITSRDAAEAVRDAAVGADKRAAAETRVKKHEASIEQLEGQIDELESRRDDQYERWKRAPARAGALPSRRLPQGKPQVTIWP
jgi:hypothetical protein